MLNYPMLCKALFLLSIFYANSSHAILKIDITRGTGESTPISITRPYYDSDMEADIATEVIKIVAADLNRSGLFNISEDKNLDVNVNAIPSEDWSSKIINAETMFTSSVKYTNDSKIEIKYRLWDGLTKKQLAGKALTTSVSGVRRTAHIIADNIYHRMTGENGYFDTRIVYISQDDKLHKRIAIMDQDGANNKFLTNGNEIVLTPRFSPKSQRIVYMSYANNHARIYIREIESGKDELLGNYIGVNSAPRFSPSGKTLLMARSLNGVTDIYEIILNNRKRSRLTVKSSINTSASYSPDEKYVVFNSDRGGSQQIYVMSANGKGQKRISFGPGSYATPVWSPRGDWIAFTKILEREFYIGLMKPDGSGERLLANGYLVESPTWSPNGRVIIFTKEIKTGRTKRSELHSIDLTGRNERRIPTPTDAYDPSWSPLLS